MSVHSYQLPGQRPHQEMHDDVGNVNRGSLGWRTCEGGVDVVGVVTLLVRRVAQVLHGDQVVALSVQLEVQEVEGKEEDRDGQVEVEEERGELKEKRTCTWMTSDETQT